VHGGIANQLVKFPLGLGAHDRFIGGADGAEHAGEAARGALTVEALGFMLEIFERERDVLRHPLQHREDFIVQRSRLALGDQQDADAAAVADQRHCRRCTNLAIDGALPPGQRAGVVEEIVADANLAVAESFAADARSFPRFGIGRDMDVAQADRILAKTGDKPQAVGTLFLQEDGRGQKVTAREGRFTDLRVELVRRFRVQDRFVRGIQCRKRPRGIRRLQVPIP
jgi:hypothetical protein